MSGFSETAALVPGLNATTSLGVGQLHYCAVQGGMVSCWGYNYSRQLGNDLEDGQALPREVAGTSGAVSVAAGDHHTCAVIGRPPANSVVCWGDNRWGQLGVALPPTMRSAPAIVPGISNVVRVSVGGRHSCAEMTDTSIRCWGDNSYGQLGDNMELRREQRAVQLAPGVALTNALMVSTGTIHTCTALNDGGAFCWGFNGSAALGVGVRDTGGPMFPRPIMLPSGHALRHIAAGNSHTCGLGSSGEVLCWGYNQYGEVGVGRPSSNTFITSPALVPSISGATDLDTGGNRTCAVMRDGSVRCWGDNARGELGDGMSVGVSRPVSVLF